MTTVRILRLKELQKKLDRMPKTTKQQIRAAIAKSAEEIVGMMKRLVPVDQGDLRDSIGWTFGPPPKKAVMIATTNADLGLGQELTASIYAGNAKAYYAAFVEFGTQAGILGGRVADRRNNKGGTRKVYRSHPGTAAQPFFFPSWRANRKRAVSRIKRAVSKAAKAEAAR